LKGEEILERIRVNEALLEYELRGFLRGDEKGKTLNVSLDVLKNSLNQQHTQFESTYIDYVLGKKSRGDLMRCVADVRNVAGCIFLKLQEQDDEPGLEGLGKLFEEG